MVTWLRKWAPLIYLSLLVVAVNGGAYWLGFHNAATVSQLCASSNDLRARQILLWQYVITALPPPAHEPAAARHQRIAAEGALMNYVQHVFAPRNCAQRIPQHGPPPG